MVIIRQTSQKCIALALVVGIAGCATTSTQMVNSDGRIVDCGAWGFGVIGAPAALISTNTCINKHQSAGYREVGAPLPATSPQVLPNLKQDAPAQGGPITLTNLDNAFKLSLPAGWARAAPPPASNWQFHAIHGSLDAGLLVSSANLMDIQDWKKYSEHLWNTLTINLVESSMSEPVNASVNGFESYRSEISGVSQGIKIRYLATTVRTGKKLIYILSYCTESTFAQNKYAFEQLPLGLQINEAT